MQQVLGERWGDSLAYTTPWGREPCGWEVEQIKRNKWQTVSVDPNEGGGGEVGKWVKKRKKGNCLGLVPPSCLLRYCIVWPHPVPSTQLASPRIPGCRHGSKVGHIPPVRPICTAALTPGVPLGSVLAPLLFSTASGIHSHTGDTQLWDWCSDFTEDMKTWKHHQLNLS